MSKGGSNGGSFDDRGPWFELAGHPVHASTALVGFCIAAMLLSTAAVTFNWLELGAMLEFDGRRVLRGEVWRLVSYALWNPLGGQSSSLWFALDMLMLWWFGRELESFFGRRIFLKLCAGLVLAPALVGTLLSFLIPVHWGGLPDHFSLFIAFATMAPGVSLLFGVSAKWTALIFLSLEPLSCLAGHAWGHLAFTLSGAAFAFAYVRFQQGLWSLGSLGSLRSLFIPENKPRLRVLPPPAQIGRVMDAPAQASSAPTQKDAFPSDADAMDTIDPLLEKIARSGFQSLTAHERSQLQLAREALLRHESSKH